MLTIDERWIRTKRRGSNRPYCWLSDLAVYIYASDYEWPAALQELRTALALKPGYPTAHLWYGNSLLFLGKLPEAQAELDRAMELDPASSIIKGARAYVLVCARDYQGALAQYKKVLEVDPEFNPVHRSLAQLYVLQGKYAEALAEGGQDARRTGCQCA